MLLRETAYYFMSDKQLEKVVRRISKKLETETNEKKVMKYLNELADVGKALIRKYRHDADFMMHVQHELNDLKAQIKEVL